MAWLSVMRRASGLAIFSALAVWAIHHPGDSTDVAAGQTLGWFSVVLIGMGVVVAFVAWDGWARQGNEQHLAPESDWRRWWIHPLALDALVLGIAGTMTVSVWTNWGDHGRVTLGDKTVGGDQRAALNSVWFWWVGAAWVVTLRLVLRRYVGAHWTRVASHLIRLVMVAGVFLTVSTLHQDKISLPKTRAVYEADPDGELLRLGLDAPPNSAARMVFENRLYDGGPTATFALTNTLAGWLAITAVLAGLMLSESKHWPTRVACLIAVILSLVAVHATDSRAAMLAIACTGAAALAWDRVPRLRHWSGTTLGMSTMIALPIGAFLAGILVLSGDRNWREDVPASLGFRMDYWASTLKMVADRPWLGIASGNFKTAYPRYRSDWAHEEIADPHHFWFETLALGGWLAGSLLLVLMIVFALQAIAAWSVEPRKHAQEPGLGDGTSPFHDQALGWAVSGGALLGWVLVWWNGIRSGAVPDFQATQFAFPAAVVVAMGLWRWPIAWTRECVMRMTLAGLGCLLVHLSFSGGMTVPGLSLVAWTFMAIASTVPTDRRDTPVQESVSSPSRVGGFVQPRFVSLGLATAFIVMGITVYQSVLIPVWARQEAMSEARIMAQGAMTSRRMRLVFNELDRAEKADPLAWEPAHWRADFWSRISLASESNPGSQALEAERRWGDALERARQKSLGNPVALARLLEQPLRRYAHDGNTAGLDQACEILSEALAMHPTQQTWVAQMALLVQEQEREGLPMPGSLQRSLVSWLPNKNADGERWSKILARRAVELGDSGGVMTRQLWLQWLTPVGASAPSGENEQLRADVAMAEILAEE